MTERPYDTARLDTIERSGRGGWVPIRRHFGITAFGVNAWSGDDGAELVGEHDETTTDHEELYVVTAGHATFELDGQTVDAPPGTFVFVRDPATRRAARAAAAGTTILSVGAKPGEAYRSLPWEENADVLPLFDQGRYDEAKTRLVRALERHPDAAGLVYNLACAEARLGESEAARVHLDRAIELFPGFAELAQSDPDLESIRD
jgi:tetratricopeptide (TPR) repeat protein